jgi:hypothetical protein
MSEITAVGPRLGILGPPPKPPARSLVATDGVLQDSGDGRWMNGVNLVTYPFPHANVWSPCGAPEANVKDEIAGTQIFTFDPVAIYVEDECSSISGEYEARRDRLRTVLEAVTPHGAERILAGIASAGISPNVNPSFASGGTNVLTGSVPPREGVAMLEDYIIGTGNYDAKPMIHATPGTVDMLSSILEEDDTGTIYTQAGTPVVPGGGYVGAIPSGEATPELFQAWLWITPNVEVRLSPITVTDLVPSLDRAENDLVFIAERFALVTWDASISAAILVDWSLGPS